MTLPYQPSPSLDEILDRIADYLPDSCSSLNHNDLPETKAAITQLVSDIVGDDYTLDSHKNDLLASQRQTAKSLGIDLTLNKENQ